MFEPAPHRRFSPLASEKIAHERKLFFLDLLENQRGRYFKITEDVAGRRDTILLPTAAGRDFLEALQRIAAYDANLPLPAPGPR